MNTKSQNLLKYLKANGATPSRDLIEHFGVSRPTLSRRIGELGDSVTSIGQTTSTHYAAKIPSKLELPLYSISASGQSQHHGELIALANGEWYLKSGSKVPSLFHREFKDGLYPGWPWFLTDLRPSGFLGRAFARQLSEVIHLDTNPDNWSDADVAETIAKFGSHLQGNFIVGERALDTLLNHEHTRATCSSESDFTQLADSALNDGSIFGSSAGGEQPKFTTCVKRGNQIQNVIVKFSPPTNELAGRRWADLLIAEHIANQVLSASGFETAKTSIHEIGERVFLESERFDRLGANGRRGLVSLRALDGAFVGQGSGTWNSCADKLKAQKLITEEDSLQIARLECFGNLIANTDMHFGNLSFFLGETFPLQLAPCYDMLPMRFRPAPSGEVTTVEFQPKRPRPEQADIWQQMRPLALEFWQTVAQDTRTSKAFQTIAKKCKTSLNELS